MIKAAVFDLDGTLLDTIGDLAWCVNTALSENGFPVHDDKKYCYFVGNGARNLISRALPSDIDPAVYEAVYSRYSELYESNWNVRTRPYDGIREMLEGFRADGIPMAVVSNKPHERTLEVIEYYFPDIFKVVLGQRPGIPMKPDPRGVFDALETLGAAPEHTFYLGDTGVDIETGINAGVYTAGALWGFRTAEELTAAGARVLCRTPKDALDAARVMYST